ncbi:hypothetical protein PPERSA_08016 [Pseudocohnilembus persalinus]|uniref:Poly(A) RNA polymerase mitochondrial-like central palm domain-containing protein n=1 Tax=Pseudocohnilembus persalinus TaxID=266149 RepID=A0A0V0R2I7_PSEPJ|nr:hypothetical protein PPERSA_08016 [Pseudocohnilembus persalinus]|eukprot:KRX08705.1 hypothetical protein PPERSA_08016 [Pseudocohnilembus persalinus]
MYSNSEILQDILNVIDPILINQQLGIAKAIKKEFKVMSYKTSLFGSCLSKTQILNSDIDLSIMIDGVTTREKEQKKMREILQKLQSNKYIVENFKIDPILEARVPLINLDSKIYDDIQIQLLINNEIAVRNTKLLKEYFSIHPKFLQLAKLVKLWFQAKNLQSKNMLKSYAISIFVIHFLQRKLYVPYLQKLHVQKKMSSYIDRDENKIKEYNTFFMKFSDLPDDQKQKLKSAEKIPIDQLFIDFFQHMKSFINKQQYFNIIDSRSIKRDQYKDPSFYSCLDPFMPNVNPGERPFDFRKIHYIKNQVKKFNFKDDCVEMIGYISTIFQSQFENEYIYKQLIDPKIQILNKLQDQFQIKRSVFTKSGKFLQQFKDIIQSINSTDVSDLDINDLDELFSKIQQVLEQFLEYPEKNELYGYQKKINTYVNIIQQAFEKINQDGEIMSFVDANQKESIIKNLAETEDVLQKLSEGYYDKDQQKQDIDIENIDYNNQGQNSSYDEQKQEDIQYDKCIDKQIEQQQFSDLDSQYDQTDCNQQSHNRSENYVSKWENNEQEDQEQEEEKEEDYEEEENQKNLKNQLKNNQVQNLPQYPQNQQNLLFNSHNQQNYYQQSQQFQQQYDSQQTQITNNNNQIFTVQVVSLNNKKKYEIQLNSFKVAVFNYISILNKKFGLSSANIDLDSFVQLYQLYDYSLDEIFHKFINIMEKSFYDPNSQLDQIINQFLQKNC